MTVSAQTVRNVYSGDDATLIFAYTFRLLQEGDEIVTITDTSVSPETVQTLTVNSDYTIDNIGNPAGGDVTLILGGGSVLTVAPTTTDQITILRETPLTQLLDLIANDPFPSQDQENAFDKLTLIVQEHDERLDRSVFIPASSVGVNVALPVPVADQFIGWNSTADALVNLPDPSVSAAAEAAAAAASAAAALISENNAATSETNAGISETNASASEAATAADVITTNADVVTTGNNVLYAMEWAIEPEDDPVSVAAGGDNSTTFSALHWAAKALASASAANIPTPTFPGDEGLVMVARAAGLPGNAYTLETAGTSTIVDDFTIKNNGGVISTAPMILDNIMLNAMNISTNGSLTAGTMVDGFVDTYTDQTGIDLGSSADQVFEGGSYRTPIPTVANAETLDLSFNEAQGSLEIADKSGQGHVVTQNGNATLKPRAFKFGNGALCLDGSTQGLNLADSADWDIVASAATSSTIDLWVKHTNLNGDEYYVAQVLTSSDEWQLAHRDGTGHFFTVVDGGITEISMFSATPITDNDWHHVVMSKTNDVYSIYLDGYQTGYVQDSDVQDITAPLYIGYTPALASREFSGYMDDIRITNNNAFTTAPIPQPFLHYTLDDNAANTTVTDFGSGGNNGTTNGGVFTSALHADGKVRNSFDLNGSSDYIDFSAAVPSIRTDTTGTVTAWINPDNLTGNQIIFCVSDQSSNQDCIFFLLGNVLRMNFSGGATEDCIYDTTTTISPNVWTHVALVQDGVLPKIFINGVDEVLTPVTATTPGLWLSGVGAALDFGGWGARRRNGGPNDLHLEGRMDDVRYYQNVALTQTQIQSIRTAGIAGYYGLGSPQITVPSTAHVDDANTLLLLPFDHLVQGQDLVDISTGGAGSPHTVTSVNGAGATGHFGSSYASFDGTGDYLSVPDSTAFAFGTGTFSGSLWFRKAVTATQMMLLNKRDGSANNEINLINQSSDLISFGTYNSSGGGANVIANSATGLAVDNDWHHLYFQRNDLDLGLYLDGTQIAFAAGTAEDMTSTASLIVGANDSPAIFYNGDMDDIHIKNAVQFSAAPVAQPQIQLTMNDNAANTTVVDTGLLSNNGTAQANTDTKTIAGQVNTALTFNGTTDFVNIDTSATSIENDTRGSIVAWVDANLGSLITVFSVSHLTSSPFNFSEFRITPGGQLEVVVQDNGSNLLLATTTATISGTWTHIAVVQDGVTPVFYINGVAETPTPTTGATQWFANVTTQVPNGCRVGVNTVNSTNFQLFDGEIDDLRYYDLPLSQTQINQIYNSGNGTEAFAVDTISVPAVQAVADANSVLLLNCNTLDGSNSKHIPTFNGGASISETTSPLTDLRGSLELDGVNQDITIPYSTDFDLFAVTTQDYTFDVWFKHPAIGPAADNYILQNRTDNSNRWLWGNFVGSGLQLFIISGGTIEVNCKNDNKITDDSWHHYVMVKDGAATAEYGLWFDGVQVAYDRSSASATFATSPFYIGSNNGAGGHFRGNLSDLRIQNNNDYGVTPINYPILIVGEGTDEDTTTTNDGIAGAVTFNGGCKLDDAPPTGTQFNATTSIFFPGTTSDYLSVANGSTIDAFNITNNLTDDWTIDAWINPSSTAGFPTIMSQDNTTPADYWQFLIFTTGGLLQFIKIVASGNETVTGTTDMSTLLNVWTHVAFVKVAADVAIYVNGVKDSANFAWTTVDTESPANPVEIGRRATSGIQPFAGYMEQVRMVRTNLFGVDPTGVGGFVPPAAALTRANSGVTDITVPTVKHTADANTLLLTHFEPGIIAGVNSGNPLDFFDYSTTPHTLTPVNSPIVTGAYAENSVNGRMTFNGTTDSIQIPNHSDFNIFDSSKTDNTVHFWIRFTDHTGTETIMTVYESATDRWQMRHVDGSGFDVQLEVNNVVNFQTGLGGEITDSLWHHIALIKIGSESSLGAEMGMYVDGDQVNYGQDPQIGNFTGDLYIGERGDSANFFDGDMDMIVFQPDNVPFSASPNVGVTDTITVPLAEPVGASTPGVMTLQSVAVAVAPLLPAPDTLKIVLDLEDIDPTIVLNTDIVAEVSRDGGSTFTSATLAQTGQATNGRRLVEDEVDVSAQPDPGAGNSTIVYRYSTFNDIQMRLHATSELWG